MKVIANLILVILAVLMLFLWVTYISIRFDVNKKSSKLDKEYWIFSGLSSTSTDTVADEYFFSPLSVSLVLSGEGYTSEYNEELTNILYDSHKPLIQEILSPSYICAPASNEAWSNALNLNDFVLIEYPSAFPYTVISLFAEGSNSFPQGEVAKIKSLILFSDENENLSALSKDDEGNIFSYLPLDTHTPSLIYDFNSNNLAAYTVNKGFIGFTFNFKASESLKNENLPDEYKMLSASPKLGAVSIDFPLQSALEDLEGFKDSSYPEFASHPVLLSIFNIFEINPSIVGYYSDPVSGHYFVGQTMMLSIDTTGVLEYSATDKGSAPVTVANLLSSERTDFSVSELITAATVFLGRLPDSVIGEGATPILDKVSYSQDKDEFTLNFSYYHNLCRILKNQEQAQLTMTFSNNALINARFTPVTLTSTTTKIPENEYASISLPPYAVSKLLDSNGEFSLVYSVTEDRSVLPVWVEELKGGKK